MPLNESDVAHLISRTEIVTTEAKIDELKNSNSISDAVNVILQRNLDRINLIPNGAPFFFDLPSNNNGWAKIDEMRRWWVDQMAHGNNQFREKMVLFWHGHFVTNSSASTTFHHHTTWNQNLYRQNAFGNFRDFAIAMGKDPLMLKYLNNDENQGPDRHHPQRGLNENFGRELLELFILGLNHYGLISNQQFAYTQNDVLSCAKAWTGHSVDYYDWRPAPVYRYYPERHIDETITFLGKTAKFNADDTVDRVLEANTPYREISARFVARKLWSFLAYPNPETSVIDSIINPYKNTLLISDLVRSILTHPQFYSEKAKKGLVSTPAEFTARVFNLTGVTLLQDENRHGVLRHMPDMGMNVLSPPNVSGWRPNRYWLSTSNVGARGVLARNVFDANASKSKFRDLVGLSDTQSAVRTAARRIGIVDLHPNTLESLSNWLNKERSRNSSTDFRSSGLLHLLIMSPDFQVL